MLSYYAMPKILHLLASRNIEHDSAPPNWLVVVRNHLDTKLSQYRIKREPPIAWPLGSPNSISIDFSYKDT